MCDRFGMYISLVKDEKGGEILHPVEKQVTVAFKDKMWYTKTLPISMRLNTNGRSI